MAKVRPIKPDEVDLKKHIDFPDVVLESFNELIAEEYDKASGTATIKQKDVMARMVEKGLERDTIFPNHWLDVESLYESAGWCVYYDKPGFNESYEPTFSFKRRK